MNYIAIQSTINNTNILLYTIQNYKCGFGNAVVAQYLANETAVSYLAICPKYEVQFFTFARRCYSINSPANCAFVRSFKLLNHFP